MADIVTLTINPSIDLFTNVARVVPASKLRAHAIKRDPGGGGINVARVAHRLGGKVTAIYPTGGALGQLLRRLLDREGVDSVVTPSHTETRENFTAYAEDSGEQYRFVFPGARLHKAEWEACLARLTEIEPKPKFVVLSGSLPPGVPDDFYAIATRAAKSLGAHSIVDTADDALHAALKEGVYLVKPNINELRALLGRTLDVADAPGLTAACRELIAAGQTEYVALTLGEEGALLVGKDAAWRAAPMGIEAVSTVGAGDSFLGGLVWALADGKDMQEAFRAAMAAGSAAVMTPGTGLCQSDDVARLLPQVKISEV